MILFASFHIHTEIFPKSQLLTKEGPPEIQIQEAFTNEIFEIPEFTPETIKKLEEAMEGKYYFMAKGQGLKIKVKATMITPMIMPEEEKKRK